MIRQNWKLISLAGAVFFFSQCRKVIELDLKEVTPQIVIEGSITPDGGIVKITTTQDFYHTNTFEKVSGAIVEIADDAGNFEVLAEVAPGIYKTVNLQAAGGKTYTLKVHTKGQEYVAVSQMPQPVILDTLLVKETSRWGEKVLGIQAQFRDPPGIPNWYRFSLVRNSDPFTAKFIFEDRLYDGNLIAYDIAQASEEPLKSGDSIEVVMYGIDRQVYNYFLSIPSNWEPPAVPANPLSNISNHALGYFSAASVSEKRIVIP